MFERILIPVDGSVPAVAALALAGLLPSRHVRLLHVETDTKGPMLASIDELHAWQTACRTRAIADLVRAGAPLRHQGRRVEPAFAFGDPAEQILRSAADADLIVMGTHGRGAGGRAVFGSVADRVARRAPVATLLVRGAAESASLARIVVPLDGSHLAETAVPLAATLADDLGLPIHLVQVIDTNLVRASVQAGPAAAAASARADTTIARDAATFLDHLAQCLRDQDLRATHEVRSGVTADQLLAALRPTDLVVMTTHGRGGIRRWLLGSVADQLVRHAPGPVLLVRGTAEQSNQQRDGG